MKNNQYLRGVILVLICFLYLTGCGSAKDANTVTSDKTAEELYSASMEDAMIADADEIEPVVAIQEDSENVVWSEDEEQVLMLTYHSYPDSYKEGTNVSLAWGEVWVTSIEEMVNWYKENKDGVEDWSLRFNQLLGLPAEGKYTHFSAIWVEPEDMFRPAYVSDITNPDMRCNFGEHFDADYKKWFDNNIIFSYYDDAFPWTRLGYTYDWFDNGTDRGLSEFVINTDSSVDVEFTKKVDDFVKWTDLLGDNWESTLK